MVRADRNASLQTTNKQTYQISARSVQLFPRYGKGGTYARAHLRKCRCTPVTPPMTCVICIAAWSLNTHQMLLPSAHLFPSYRLAANFDALSLCTCHVPQWLPRWMGVGSIHDRKNVATRKRKPLVKRTRGCRDIGKS